MPKFNIKKKNGVYLFNDKPVTRIIPKAIVVMIFYPLTVVWTILLIPFVVYSNITGREINNRLLYLKAFDRQLVFELFPNQAK